MTETSSITKLPKLIPIPNIRPPQKDVPQTKEERILLKEQVDKFVKQLNLIPPLGHDEINDIAGNILDEYKWSSSLLNYTTLLVSNAIWHDSVASVPYSKRLLLLPKCLRDEEKCPAPFDEFGLLCKTCGLCTLQDLQAEAEKLGYASLIAEGSPLVMKIIQTGQIDAIVGVSCLNVLKKMGPYMEAAAIPGMAIPLLNDDCKDVSVDMEWIWDAIHLTSDDTTRRLDLSALQKDVQEWFNEDSLNQLIGACKSKTESLAREWLIQDGKRWRPFLTICSFLALQEDLEVPISDELKKLAISVECFHKASLIHDDIEDDDQERYGKQTLHEKHGTPIALNLGDFLIGEGYRLISEVDVPLEKQAIMQKFAADGHRTLSIGQGEELYWTSHPKTLKPAEVLDIFRQKTAPAFEVALVLGGLFTNASDETLKVFQEYSENLGIAYQIQDDMDDFIDSKDPSDILALRPSIMLALTYAKAREDDKKFMQDIWERKIDLSENWDELLAIIEKYKIEERALRLLETYKEKAMQSLKNVDSFNLKGLLRRVLGKIFNEINLTDMCNEYSSANDADSKTSS